MVQKDRYIRFDWAVKRLLRNKANFGVLEGFLTVLLGEPIRIVEILESEGNQQRENDKFNRVDIKARNSKDEIIIVEVQNTREIYYLERILFGVAKAITEHIELGELYSQVKKVYSISILYFDIGRATITCTTVRIPLWACIRAIFWRSPLRRRMPSCASCLPKSSPNTS